MFNFVLGFNKIFDIREWILSKRVSPFPKDLVAGATIALIHPILYVSYLVYRELMHLMFILKLKRLECLGVKCEEDAFLSSSVPETRNVYNFNNRKKLFYYFKEESIGTHVLSRFWAASFYIYFRANDIVIEIVFTR